MVIGGTALDLSGSELSWALNSLVHQKGDGAVLGNLRELGWIVMIEVGTYGDKIATAHVVGNRKPAEISAGATITCELNQKKFVDALAPKLGTARSMRAVLLALFEVKA